MATNKKISDLTALTALAAGDKFVVYDASDTTEAKSIVYSEILSNTDTMTNKTLTSPVINTGISGTAITDEDDMTSDSNTKIPTQQSVKAYIDSGTITLTNKSIDADTNTISNIGVDEVDITQHIFFADAYADLQDAVDAAETAGGGKILIPEDGLTITETVTITEAARYITFEGISKGRSAIIWGGSEGGTMFQIGDGNGTACEYITFRNLLLSGGDSAAICIDDYSNNFHLENMRMGRVLNGVAYKMRGDTYYKYLDGVELRGLANDNSTAVETNATNNAVFFKNVRINNWDLYGVHIKGEFNGIHFWGGSIETCGGQAIYSSSGGQMLSIDSMYIENCAGVGEGMIETTVAVKGMSVRNMYFNPDAVNYCIKVVDTMLDIGTLYVSDGFSSVVNLDDGSLCRQSGEVYHTDILYSGDGVWGYEDLGDGRYQKYVTTNFDTVAKSGGTSSVDLQCTSNIPYAIEVTTIGRFEASDKGISKKWIVFFYMATNNTLADSDVDEIFSVGDANKSDLALSVTAVGSDFQARFTMTNNDAVFSFSPFVTKFEILTYGSDRKVVPV